MDGTASATIGSVERAAAVLRLFVDLPGPSLGITEIATHLSLSKAVVHRVVSSLRETEFLEADAESRRYRLGPGSLALGLAYLDRVDVRTLARPDLEQLSAVTQETATLSVRHGFQRVYIDQVTPGAEIRMTVAIGQPYPLHAGSSSKAFLAFVDEAEREEYFATQLLTAVTDSTIVDRAALQDELALIRKRGFARSLGERQPGAASVAAPVLDHDGKPVAVVSVCGPSERFRRRADEAAEQLLLVTRGLSRRLGHREGQDVR
jgi:IclR family acetate operon transcriptional repressor